MDGPAVQYHLSLSLSFASLYLLNYVFARKFQQNTGVIKLRIVV